MQIGFHPERGFHPDEPKVHGRLYELFHSSAFWAVVLTITVVVGVYFVAKLLANTLQSSFTYQPSFSP